MSDPDLNLLIALDALLTEESVARAARRLRLSVSAMSRTLARLREETGDPLLVRAGRRMVLTPCAEGLRERARNAVHEARSLLRPAAPEPDLSALRRTFTIRANDGFVEAFGARLIGAVHAEAPLLRLSFAPKVEKSPRYLREGTADLEIGVVGDMGPEVRIQALYRDRFVAVVRKDHPLARLRKITVAHYLAYGHVVVSRHGESHGPVDQALAQAGLERTVAALVPSFPTALAVARASDLVALVPASFLDVPPERQKSARSAATFAFDLPVKTDPITISQMWHPRLEQDPVHRWLREVIRRVCGAPRAKLP